MLGICFVTLFLLVWFNSNAFIEYSKQLGYSQLFRLPEYSEYSKESPEVSYIDFLLEFYDSFWVRLLSCPLCLSVWLGGFYGFVTAQILLAPIFIVCGLLLYLVTVKLM